MEQRPWKEARACTLCNGEPLKSLKQESNVFTSEIRIIFPMVVWRINQKGEDTGSRETNEESTC